MLVELRPPIQGWCYYCVDCAHLTAPTAELQAAMLAKPAGALGIVAAWPMALTLEPMPR